VFSLAPPRQGLSFPPQEAQVRHAIGDQFAPDLAAPVRTAGLE
jgi:hypothetical protein